jgi:hypothetical protein
VACPVLTVDDLLQEGVGARTFDGFAAEGRLRHQLHVGLIVDDGDRLTPGGASNSEGAQFA